MTVGRINTPTQRVSIDYFHIVYLQNLGFEAWWWCGIAAGAVPDRG
jgi:hypothetical protein